MSKLIDDIIAKASALGKHIVLPEGEEARTIMAAEKIVSAGIAKLTLVGDIEVAKKVVPYVDFSKLNYVNPATSPLTQKYAELFYELRKSKGVTLEGAMETAKDPVYFGTLMVKAGDADGLVSGAIHSTGDTIRPALQIIKSKPGISCVSSCFIMVLPKENCYKSEGVFIFGDCAINPSPTPDQLAEIAIASADSAKSIIGVEPKVAMLSFSTKGSAKHEFIDNVVEATAIVKRRAPELDVDGELQADAALISKVAQLKAPGSTVAGQANVLIFPDLQSGNIGYKLVQRLAGAEAIGPICQGFAKPVNDLSRGCSVEDIVDVVAMTALQA